MDIYRVSSHTKHVGVGSTYVAIPGTKVNGIDFIAQAIEQGAQTVVVPCNVTLSSEVTALCAKRGVALKRVDDPRAALAQLSAQAYDNPADKLTLLAVTGTDGKTTSSYVLYHILKKAGKKVALLSGVEHMIGDEIYEADLTTEKPDYLHYFFDRCVCLGIQYVVMEVSAQAHTMHRLDGLTFGGVIFTNLAREHGESYQNLDDYFAAKLAVIAHKKSDAPLVTNIDAEWGCKVCSVYPDALTSGFAAQADGQITVLQETFQKQLLEITIGGKHILAETPLVGRYNAQNIAGVVMLAHQLGISSEYMVQALAEFTGAPGRLERFSLANGALAIVDYGHTPQAFQAVLPMLKKRARKLFVVFGAAGGKDKPKRPMMGKIAVTHADMVIVSMDNPRMEDPQQIAQEILADLTVYERASVLVELDREKAIRAAYSYTQEGDIIVMLGKGVETVQIIGQKRVPYSDVAVVRSLMK